MSLIDIILLAVALAMDCLTVSIVSGVIEVKSEEVKDEKWWIIRMAFLFGLFQAMMPLIGVRHQPFPGVYGGLRPLDSLYDVGLYRRQDGMGKFRP